MVKSQGHSLGSNVCVSSHVHPTAVQYELPEVRGKKNLESSGFAPHVGTSITLQEILPTAHSGTGAAGTEVSRTHPARSISVKQGRFHHVAMRGRVELKQMIALRMAIEDCNSDQVKRFRVKTRS